MHGVRRGRTRHGTSLLCAALSTAALLAGATGCADGDGEGDARKPAPHPSASHKAAGGDERGGEHGERQGHGKGDAKEHDKGARGTPDDGAGDGAGEGAADGTDTGACDDARCEVKLSAGDKLHPRASYGIQEFAVRDIEDHVIEWTALFSGGRVSMSSHGAQRSTTSCSNASCSGELGTAKGTLEMNGLTLEFTSIGENSAVVKVSPPG